MRGSFDRFCLYFLYTLSKGGQPVCHPVAGYWGGVAGEGGRGVFTIKALVKGTVGSQVFQSNRWILTSLNPLHCSWWLHHLCTKVWRFVCFLNSDGDTIFFFCAFFLAANAAIETFPFKSESPVSPTTCWQGLFAHSPALCSHPHLDYIQSCDSSPQRAAC